MSKWNVTLSGFHETGRELLRAFCQRFSISTLSLIAAMMAGDIGEAKWLVDIGVVGPVGCVGPVGVVGPVGCVGPVGVVGPVGCVGPVGVVGPVGCVGPVGV